MKIWIEHDGRTMTHLLHPDFDEHEAVGIFRAMLWEFLEIEDEIIDDE